MNIKAKVIELMEKHFSWLNDDEDTEKGVSNRIASQCQSFDELAIDRASLEEFALVLIEEFELEDIEFSEIMKWRRVCHIVRFIENNTSASSSLSSAEEAYLDRIAFMAKPFLTGDGK